MSLLDSWAYKNFIPSDPINIILKNTTVQDITNLLTQSGGWKRPILAGDLYLIDSDMKSKKQDDQLIYTLSLTRRLHMRLWQISSDTVIASVHHEELSIPTHHVLDFETAERFLAGFFSRQGWHVEIDSEDKFNYFGDKGKPYNSGRATIIQRP